MSDGGIGDSLERALSAVGLTSARVSAWLGKPCRCPERRNKLNALGHWAQRVLSGRVDHAVEYLDRILEE